jgi:integrase
VRAYFERGRWRCRPQISPGVDGRLNLELNLGDTPEAKREAAAQARAGLIGELLRLLKAAGLDADLRERAARNLATAKPADVATHEAVLRKAAGGVFARPEGELTTVQAFGERWTSGELARQFPDQVRLRKCRNEDRRRLSRWLYPVVGQLPLRAVQLHHLEAIAQSLAQANLRGLYRRAILSLVKRLLDLAVYPAKLIERSPFPVRDFLPKTTPRTLPMLRPSEDLQLMRCTRILVKYRLFYGLLCRVGFRRSELKGLRWDAIDFEGGYVRFTNHKTVLKMGEKLVPLEAPELRALRWWRSRQPADEPRVFPVLICQRLLRHLKMAGVTREELLSTTDTRRCISLHHLRGSFVTIKLAQGWPESRVMDCTGHLNLGTLAKYRRAGRLAERLGDWTPLDKAIPEIAADRRDQQKCPQGKEKARGNGALPSSEETWYRPSPSLLSPNFHENPLTAPSANDVCGQPADTTLTPRCPAFFADCLPRAA